MGLLDNVLGGLLGGGGNAGPLQQILGSVLAGQGGGGYGGGSGIQGLIGAFEQAGLGHVANSWVGNGPNQPVSPNQLQQVFGQNQVNQWSQQTGMPQETILSELSRLLPHAVDQMTPNGQMPQGGGGADPFDAPGLELPQR